MSKYGQPDETTQMWNRNARDLPNMKCPFCGKMTTLWIVHKLTCDHCGEYLGCND